MNFSTYTLDGFYDEMFEQDGQPRVGCNRIKEKIESLDVGELEIRQKAAEKALYDMGITFNVYKENEGVERIMPVDLVPRVIESSEWTAVEAGLKQRIKAINLFIDDVYHDKKILKEGIIPEDLVLSAEGYLPACEGLNPPGGIWCHITGTDLVRGADGVFRVLEDNLRCPSGASYVLANRALMKRTFPEVFAATQVQPVIDYSDRLVSMLCGLAPESAGGGMPSIGLLTPGAFNSAYFEHTFLAQEIGAELIEGRDLVISNGDVCMKTTSGLKKVDVIYRRINDDYLDPEAFNPDSVLGCPGLMEAYRAGRVTLVNAPGTGVADDKVIYAYVPEMIRYYLKEEPLLPNVETYLCSRDEDRAYVLDHLDELVVKAANEAGGYGMLIGPHSTREEQDNFAERIKAKPRNYIAQPTLQLSRAPVIVGDHFEGRHLDLRPYILYGTDGIYVMPGGLTRVALRKGSLVVNSSQGGGSKDTWVLADRGEEPQQSQGQEQS